MIAVRPPLLACLLVLVGCSPEVVQLVHFTDDAGGEGDSNELSEPEPEPVRDQDASRPRDAGTSGRMDASVRPEFDAWIRPEPDLDAGPMARACESNAGCRTGEFCNISGCAVKRGTCATRPEICGGEQAPNPVCGCDGIRYFNDCLRKSAGVPLDPSCSNTHPCGDRGQSCPGDADCARLSCDGKEGQCWVVPASCGLYFGGDLFVSCDAGVGGAGSVCMNACQAIQLQQPVMKTRCSSPWGPGGFTGGFPPSGGFPTNGGGGNPTP